MPVGDFRWLPLLIAICGSPMTPVATARDGPPPPAAEAVPAGLRDKAVETRRAAAQRLRDADRAAQRAAIPALIDLLMNEKDGQVRLAVFEVVTALGPEAEPSIPALLHTLRARYGGSGQEESHQDYRAALALAAVGKPAVEGLRGLIGDAKLKAAVRAEAVMGLGRIGGDAGAAVPDLIALLGDPDERIGRETATALGRIGEAAVGPLIASAADARPVVRARAVESLGASAGANGRAGRAVLSATRDASPDVRAAALKSLARVDLPPEEIAPTLVENLRRDEEGVRLAVVDLVMARRGLLPALASDLEALLTARNADVSRVAAYLLAKLGPGAASRLIVALRDEESRIDQIASSLAGIGRPIVGMLNEALEDRDPRVRRGAALALGQIRPAVAGTARRLAAGLGAPEREVRADVLAALGSLGTRAAAEAVPAARKSLGDEAAEVRLEAVEFLSRAAPRDARLLADLIARLDDPDPRVIRKAIDAIRGLGPASRDALPAVIGKLKATDADVRLASVELVKGHGPAAAAAVPALIALLDDPEPKLRAAAAQSLGVIGPPARPAFERLAALLSSDQPGTRESAVSAIGSLSLEADMLKPSFNRALRDEKPEVRRAAMRAIQKLGPKGAIFVPDIILMAEKKENLRSVERMLRRFEGQGPDVRSLPELIKHLDHGQDSVRLLAIKFLALAGERARDAIPALERMRDDPNAEVRKQAEAACKRIKNEPGASDRRSG